MPGVQLWAKDTANDIWIPVQVDAQGRLKVDMSNISFLDLADTPSSYSGQALKPVRVNAGESALEFATGYLFVPLATPAPIRRHYTSPISTSPRAATVSSISSDVITLTANEAYRFWAAPGEADPPDGNMYLKIANTTKDPNEYAWVKASPAVNQLQVTDSADISGWLNGETISTDVDNPVSGDMELDISPLIPDGAKGILALVQVEDSGTIATGKGTALSKEGVSGTNVWAYSQVTAIRTAVYPVTPIQTNRHLFARDRACGTDTLKLFVVVHGYFI